MQWNICKRSEWRGNDEMSTSLFKPRPVSTLYRREHDVFTSRFYQEHNSEVGYQRVCFEFEEPRTKPKSPPEKPDES